MPGPRSFGEYVLGPSYEGTQPRARLALRETPSWSQSPASRLDLRAASRRTPVHRTRRRFKHVPLMSWSPNAFGALVATGCVLPGICAIPGYAFQPWLRIAVRRVGLRGDTAPVERVGGARSRRVLPLRFRWHAMPTTLVECTRARSSRAGETSPEAAAAALQPVASLLSARSDCRFAYSRASSG